MNHKKILNEISKVNRIMGTPVNEALNMVTLNNTSYSNLKFDKDGTQYDVVNKPLLDDLNTAAKNAGLVATITTAKTGHPKLTINGRPSRHMDGTGVDIAILDGIGSGYATNSKNGIAKFRDLGNKLKDELVSMGYVWNIESGNDKAVLWQTNTGGNHFNHLHVSNRTGQSSSTTQDNTNFNFSDIDFTSKEGIEKFFSNLFKSKTSSSNQDPFLKNLLKSIIPGLSEQNYGSFGKSVITSSDGYTIPSSKNTKVSAPVSGKIENITNRFSCKNQISIKHKIDNKEYYLEFCGLDSLDVSIGENVSRGQTLGTIKDKDVNVTLYNSNNRVVKIGSLSSKEEPKIQQKPYKKNLSYYASRSKSSKKDPFLRKILGIPFSGFNSVTEEKLNEDIKNIKRLL
jgi:murein DD-endopeptidase MepM/ murein hydrolase activator NlpD